MVTADKQRKAVTEFVRNWQDKGYEKGQTQPFWSALLSQAYGIS